MYPTNGNFCHMGINLIIKYKTKELCMKLRETSWYR